MSMDKLQLYLFTTAISYLNDLVPTIHKPVKHRNHLYALVSRPSTILISNFIGASLC